MPLLTQNPDLLRQFHAGDRDALEEVYWGYVEKVETFLRSRLGRRAVTDGGVLSADVADLVQDVFLKAFSVSARRAYDGRRPFGPYLLTIARNTLIDRARRAKWEIPTETASLELALEATPPAYADPWTVETVERFVGELPAYLRAVHERRYVDGLSQRDAAAALGLSRQELRTMELHMRERLAAELRRTGRDRVAPAIAGDPEPGPIGAWLDPADLMVSSKRSQ
jgi:RNA polymerase sigma factor (sigma-70 family)